MNAQGSDQHIATFTPPGRPLLFGEVLFDVFPDGSEVPGGAPLNVAWHLQGFGLHPLLVSRVGADRRGRQIHAVMTAWGMDTSAIQIDSAHQTGVVQVAISRGQPSFDIVADQAYDHIDARQALAAAAGIDCELVYHGSLAGRAPVSGATLGALRNSLGAPACVDVNLRPPWWNRDQVTDLMRAAAWVKLNDVELEMISGRQLPDAAALERAAHDLRDSLGIATLLVTRGAQGAMLLNAEGVFSDSPATPGEIIDTVGAGDAFSAVSLLGIMKGWATQTTLRRALQFATLICGMRGATTQDLALYQRLLEEWEMESDVQA